MKRDIRYYLGNAEFVLDETNHLVLDRIHCPGGYIDQGGVHIMLPDFQGNVRTVFNSTSKQIEQTTDYYPYGMPMVSSTGAEVNRYKYGGKEFETFRRLHQYDFVARTHLPQSGMFTSPDSKAGAYPWLNPYLYCAANPIRYIDPTGEDYYTVNSQGYFELFEATDDNFDRIYSSDYKSSIDVNRGIVNSVLERKVTAKSETYGEFGVKISLFTSGNNLEDLHKFLSLNTDVEWSIIELVNDAGRTKQIIGTSHEEDIDCSQMAILELALENNLSIASAGHNHTIPNSRPSLGDIRVAKRIQDHFPNAKLFITYPYDNNKVLYYDRNTRTANQLPEIIVTPK